MMRLLPLVHPRLRWHWWRLPNVKAVKGILSTILPSISVKPNYGTRRRLNLIIHDRMRFFSIQAHNQMDGLTILFKPSFHSNLGTLQIHSR